MKIPVCVFLNFCVLNVISCSRSLRQSSSWSPAGQVPRAVCAALECNVGEQALISSRDTLGFRVDLRRLASTLPGLAALSGSTRTADGESDGRRGVTHGTVPRWKTKQGRLLLLRKCSGALVSHAKGVPRAAGPVWEQQATRGLLEMVTAPSLCTIPQPLGPGSGLVEEARQRG